MNLTYTKISVKSNFEMPFYFIGSTIRGALGHSLKKVVCINPSFKCDGCFASTNCLYYDFYESKTPKFRLAFELNKKLNFDLYLYEKDTLKTPYLLSALYKLFKEIGILKDRVKVDEFFIYVNDELVYDGEFKEIKEMKKEFSVNDFSEKIILDIKTPIRIKENNRYAFDDIKIESILRSIYHRYKKIKNEELLKLPFTPKVEVIEKNLKFKDFTRFSNRQQTKMKLGGVMGEMKLRVDENSYKLLRLAEIVGGGKQVTFGLGNIKVINER